MGSTVSAILLVVFAACINWAKEAGKAERLAGASIGVGDEYEVELAEGNRV